MLVGVHSTQRSERLGNKAITLDRCAKWIRTAISWGGPPLDSHDVWCIYNGPIKLPSTQLFLDLRLKGMATGSEPKHRFFPKWMFPKIGVGPQIIYFNRGFHPWNKPSILGYPNFWKHPNGETNHGRKWQQSARKTDIDLRLFGGWKK